MVSAAAWIGAWALLCAGFALVLLHRGARARQQASVARAIDRYAPPTAATLAKPAGAGSEARPAGASTSPPAARPPMPGSPAVPLAPHARLPLMAAWENVTARAGLGAARALLAVVVSVSIGVTAWVTLQAGLLAGTAAAVAALCVVSFAIGARAQRRRLAIVRQLPSFLDGIVRLVTLGNSVPAAFQSALQSTEAPLRECLERVARSMRAGIEIDRALTQVGAVYRIREFEFVGAVLRLSVKYGGRADVMLERMSAFMRDLEQAERELVAMSSETRLSAWVLAILPIVIGALIVASKPSYFSTMWAEPGGRRLLYLAFGLQFAGGYLLYRLARLRS